MTIRTTVTLNDEDIYYLKAKGINRANFLRQGFEKYINSPFEVKAIKSTNTKRICINIDEKYKSLTNQIPLTNFIRTLIKLHKERLFIYKYI